MKSGEDYRRELAALHRSLDEETIRNMKLKAEKRAADEILTTPEIESICNKMKRFSMNLVLGWSAAGVALVIGLSLYEDLPWLLSGATGAALFILGIIFSGDPSPNRAQSYTVSVLMLFISGALIYKTIYTVKDEPLPSEYGLIVFSGVMLLLVLRCSIMYLKLLIKVIYLKKRCTHKVEAVCAGCATKAGCYTLQPRYSFFNSFLNGTEDSTPSGDPAYEITYKGEKIILDEGRWNRFRLPAAGEVRTLYIDPFRPDIFYDHERYREELNYALGRLAVPLALILIAGNIAAYNMSYFTTFG